MGRRSEQFNSKVADVIKNSTQDDLDKYAKLAEDNLKLVYKYLSNKKLDHDEYFGIACTGYMKAIYLFDPNLGTLATLAYKSMDLEILRYNSKYHKNDAKTMSFSDLTIETDDGEEISFEDTIADEHDYETGAIYSTYIIDIVNKMSYMDVKLIYYRLCGRSFRDIAEELGVSHQSINQRVHTIKKFIDAGRVSDTYTERVKKFDDVDLILDPLIPLKNQFYLNCINDFIIYGKIDRDYPKTAAEWKNKLIGMLLNQ